MCLQAECRRHRWSRALNLFVFRHVEKTIHQAVVQKLARFVSTLHAARLLMTNGFVQEQATLQRTLDEIQEDITFLSFAVIFDKRTSVHNRFLEEFFREEMDMKTGKPLKSKAKTVQRKYIRTFIIQTGGPLPEPVDADAAFRAVRSIYSGFVHAASPYIMDIYGGKPPRFHMRGMQGSYRQETHRADLWNHFFRGIIAFAYAAKAFGDDVLFEDFHRFKNEFAHVFGKDLTSPPVGATS